MNKASGGDGIPVELFQILKDDAVKVLHSKKKRKCCTQYASIFGKLSSGHRTGKGQFSFQSKRKAMPKNVQTTTQPHSSHTLSKLCWKFSKPGFNSIWIMNFQMFKLVLEKAEEPDRDQIANIWQIIEKARELQKTHLLLLYWIHQSLWLCGSRQTVENSERDGNARPPDLTPEKSVCRSRSNS